MKSVHGQRIYIGSTDSNTVIDACDLYSETEIEGSNNIPILIAGAKKLAIVLDEKWAEEICHLAESHWREKQRYETQIEALCDEINSLKLKLSESRVNREVEERLRG